MSAILQEPVDAIRITLETLSRDSFYYEAHQVIWEAAANLHNRGVPPDPIALIAHLREMERLDAAGGESYIYQILASVPNASAVEAHTTILHEKALLRNLITECNEIIRRAYEQGRDVQELLDHAERQILQLDMRISSGKFSGIDDAIRSFMGSFSHEEVVLPDGTVEQRLVKARGITTGYTDLDKTLGGFKPGDLVIIAARPGVGKTALLLNFTHRMALAGKKVGFFSMEMGKEQLAMRMLSMASSIPTERVDHGNFSEDELGRLHAAYTELAALPIYFDDTSVLNIRSLRNRARRLKQQDKLDVMMLDYLQLMDGMRHSGELNRVQEVSDISRGMKQIARELKIPLIACSQLSRQTEQRQSRRPMLSDLRESGSIEQDADVVMLLYREDYYEKQKGEVVGGSYATKVEVNIAKHRNGPTKMEYLTYLHPFTRFEDHTREDAGVAGF